MNTIKMFWTIDDNPDDRRDLTSTDDPLKAESRYFSIVRTRTEQPAHFFIVSSHPDVPNACFDLSIQHEGSNLQREKNEDRRWSIWGNNELTKKHRKSSWRGPTRYQARALKQRLIVSGGGEIGMQALASKFNASKRTFNRYFSTEGDYVPAPWSVWNDLLELAGYQKDLVPLTLDPVDLAEEY